MGDAKNRDRDKFLDGQLSMHIQETGTKWQAGKKIDKIE